MMRSPITSCRKTQRSIELKFAKAELDALEALRQSALREHELGKLQQVSGVHDQHLLHRLYQAGITAENFQALNWLPIAMVAWASGGVAPNEVRAASLIHLYAQSTSRSEAVRLFKSWLEERPSSELWQLWQEYAQHHRAADDPADLQLTNRIILEIAKKVANADGGFAGLGRVSSAERRILETVERICGLLPLQWPPPRIGNRRLHA